MANTKSISLNGTSQYLSRTDDGGLDLSGGDISIMAWINFASLPSVTALNQIIVSKDRRVTPSTSRQYLLWLDTANNLLFAYWSSDAVITYATSDAAAVSTNNTWYHVAVTADVSAKNITLYINGSSIARTQPISSATSIQNGGEKFQIGAGIGSGVSERFFNGKIDEVGIYNTVLSAATISSDYNSGNGTERSSSEANIVGGWRFEDDLLDVTANDNDLTNNNSATFSTDVPFTGAATNTSNFFLLF